MKQTMRHIEADGALYRGFGPLYPALIWRKEDTQWAVCSLTISPQPDGWGEMVSIREAERLYPGSTTAPTPKGIETTANLSGDDLVRYRPDLFDGYDGPTYRLSPDEEAEEDARIRQIVRELRRDRTI